MKDESEIAAQAGGADASTARERPPLRLGRWLCAIALLLVLAGWLAHERAKGRLQAYKQQLRAKGEKLTIEENLPPTPAGVTNGAKAFLSAASGLGHFPSEITPGTRQMVAPGRAFPSWQQARLPAEYFRNKPIDDVWPEVRVRITVREDDIARMASILDGSQIAFDLKYSRSLTTPVPMAEMTSIRNALAWLTADSTLALRDGNTGQAFTNWLAVTRLFSTLRDERTIQWQLWRWALITSQDGTVWALLQFEGWTDQQLAAIQKELSATSVGDFVAAWRMERARNSKFFSELRIRLDQVSGLAFDDLPPLKTIVLEIFDRPDRAGGFLKRCGWVLKWPLWASYEDEIALSEIIQTHIEAADAAQRANSISGVLPAVSAAYAKATNSPPHLIFTRLNAGPDLPGMFRSWARSHVIHDVTITAIALRRYQMRHGRYPASLAGLVPDFLSEVPRDFFDGKPLRYRLQADGQFLLYSVGEDGVDDGGDPRHPTEPTRFAWDRGRDMVWPQPASPAEVAAYIADLDAKVKAKLP